MIDLPPSKIERLFAPWVHAEVAQDDPRWSAEAERLTRKAAKMRRRNLVKRLVGLARDQADVKRDYQDKIWPTYELAKRLPPKGDSTSIVWGERRFFAGEMATKRVHLALLMKTISALNPKRVLEVGSGVGLNLLVLGARFPQVEFIGAELTAAGVEATNAAAAEGPPKQVAEFSPEPVEQSGPLANVRAQEADARALPFGDGDFDLVFSAHALEQMEAIRQSAQREMVRVSCAHVAMVEPFADWNAEGLRRDLIVAKRYFQGSVADLEGLGLAVEYVTGDIPAKLTMGMGFVLAAKAQGG